MDYASQGNARGYDGPSPAQQPQPSGIASRIAGLQKAVQSLTELSYQAKGTLGITSPETADGKNLAQPASLAEVLTDLRYRVDRACTDLSDVIQHLNS